MEMRLLVAAAQQYERSVRFSMRAVLVAVLILLEGAPPPFVQARTVATPQAEASPIVFIDHLDRLFPSSSDAEVMYAIGDQALYRSPDGGATWEFAGPPPPSDYLAVGAGPTELLLAGDHIPCGAAGGEGPPLTRSVDGGLTWQPIAGVAGIRPLSIWSEGQLALGTNCNGVLRSGDGGQSWETLPLPDNGYGLTSAAVVINTNDPSAAIALVVGTSEGGTSQVWRADLALPADQVYAGLNLAPFWGYGALAARDAMYVIGTAQGVFVSTDAGESFPALPSRAGMGGILSVDPTRASIPEAERGFGVSTVAIDPIMPDYLYAGTADGVYASSDRGETWQNVSGVDNQIRRLVALPSGERLLVETGEGVIAVPLQP